MRGIVQHFVTTMVLNCRNKQALIMGYAVPVFLLVAFVSVLGNGPKGAAGTMGRLLTISTLGGACFGLPIAMVSERERGIWRRYRLTPLGSGWFLTSTLLARFLIILSSAALQIALAMVFYHMDLPKHPLDLLVSLTCASFAFIGIGLIIACVANSIGSVQALGQSLFLPMILIGGVGVPLYILPEWAQPISLFLPGRYSVDAINNCFVAPGGVFKYPVDLIALLVIGAAAMIVGWKLFRWEPSQRLERSAPIWITLAGLTWIAIGIIVIHWNWAPAH